MTLRQLSSQIQRGWQRRGALNRLLYPLSLAYAGLMSARRWAYHFGIFTRHKLPVKVVVIGNLSLGGTGKTPLVIALVKHIKSRGSSPGVITRGYRGRAAKLPIEVDAGGGLKAATTYEAGDEPLLISRHCRVPVVADPNRVRGARLLIRKHHCDIIVSDDGFQHLALKRDLDIVVIDGERRLGNGWCIPAGPLREPPGNLARAGIVVINGEAQADVDDEVTIRDKTYLMKTHIDCAVSLSAEQSRPLSEFANQTVHAVAGIGNPARFFRQLEAHGLKIIPHEYPDHHQFTAADFAFATDGAPILMTEKDAVKCEALTQMRECPADAAQCWVVPLEVTLGNELLSAIDNALA